jgi:hypothetical protein
MTDTPAGKKSRDAAYKNVTDKLGALRMAGRLDWNMVLDLTRELDQWRTFDSPREARATMRQTYDEDRWLGQKIFSNPAGRKGHRWSRSASQWRAIGRCRSPPRGTTHRSNCNMTWPRC